MYAEDRVIECLLDQIDTLKRYHKHAQSAADGYKAKTKRQADEIARMANQIQELKGYKAKYEDLNRKLNLNTAYEFAGKSGLSSGLSTLFGGPQQ